jgi:hypothetical protein
MQQTLDVLRGAMVVVVPALSSVPKEDGKRLTKEAFTAAMKGAPGKPAFVKLTKKVDKRSFFSLLPV